MLIQNITADTTETHPDIWKSQQFSYF